MSQVPVIDRALLCLLNADVATSIAKLSRANKIRTQMLGRGQTSDAASGTSTSLSFTPVQGLEIVTPALSAAARVKEANERWFGSGTFTHVKKGGSTIPGQNTDK